jgi:hypothetical protein
MYFRRHKKKDNIFNKALELGLQELYFGWVMLCYVTLYYVILRYVLYVVLCYVTYPVFLPYSQKDRNAVSYNDAANTIHK